MDQVIIQWNCRSISNKKQEFIYLINKYNPFIIAVSEIWLKPENNFKLPSFYSLMDCRADGRAGCALFVRDHCPVTTIPTKHSNTWHSTCARVEGISFLSLYIPSPSIEILIELKHLIASLPQPTIILGDFNIHHQMWGCDSNDPLGEQFLEILDYTNLCILNSGARTLRTLPDQASSAVDLSVCSPTLAAQISWKVLDSSYGSDHFPILLSLQSLSLKRPHIIKPLLIYNINGADWDSYKKMLNKEVKALPSIASSSIEICSDALVRAIKYTAEKTFPFKNTAIGKLPSPPWWDKECTQAVKNRKKAEHKYSANMSLENFSTLKTVMDDTKSLLKNKKLDGWRGFCSALSPTTPAKVVWENIKRFRRSYNPCSCPYPASQEWAELFLTNIAPPYVPTVLDLPLDLPITESTNPLDESFSMQELTNVLKAVKDSSPGHDGITYSFIAKADKPFLQYFLNLLNCILLTGHPPSSWKSQIVLPILKPSRDPNDPRSYRPIALSSVLLKVLEHLIKNRLEWFMENEGLFGKSQYGFRKGKSTMDSLSIFTSEIRLSFTRGASVLAVFLDVEAAYDNVQLPILREKFRKLRIPERLAYLVGNLLSERKITFRGSDPQINPSRLVWRGLPQGSVLSPLLYNLYTYDLEESAAGCHFLQYADDLLIYSSNNNIQSASESISAALQSVNSWLINNGLSLSASKSTAVLFTRKRVIPLVNLSINGVNIPISSHHKFLGVILDSKLSGALHFDHIAQKCERGLNVLRCLSGVWWGAHPTSLRLLYNATVRSALDYGSFLLVPGNKAGISILDRIQSKALRIISGAMRSSPINALQVECADPPLNLRRQFLADSYLFRALQFSHHPILNLLLDLKSSPRWNSKEPPCLVKSFQKFQNIKDPVHHSKNLPLFEFKFSTIVYRPRVILDFDICHNDPHADEYLHQILNREWHDWNTIYSDASKLSPVGCVGVGIYHSQYNITQKIKCPPVTSVFTGECIGVLESIKYILIFKLKKTIIFTDSRSCLQALLSNPFSVRIHNPIIYEIKDRLTACKSRGYEVTLVWVPGHSGVTGNEKADLLAKEAVVDGDKVPFKNYCHDVRNLSSESLMRTWSSYWKTSSKSKGRLFSLVQPSVSKRPWFAKLSIPKEFCSSIIRMRLGHCSIPTHLAKIRILDSSLCECGLDEGSLNHIFFACKKYDNTAFYDDLIKLKVQFPTHILELLQFKEKHKEIFIALAHFCQKNEIKL